MKCTHTHTHTNPNHPDRNPNSNTTLTLSFSKGGKIIPSRGTIYAVAIESSGILSKWVSKCTDLEGGEIELGPQCHSVAVHLEKESYTELTDRFIALEIDFNQEEKLPSGRRRLPSSYAYILILFLILIWIWKALSPV